MDWWHGSLARGWMRPHVLFALAYGYGFDVTISQYCCLLNGLLSNLSYVQLVDT